MGETAFMTRRGARLSRGILRFRAPSAFAVASLRTGSRIALSTALLAFMLIIVPATWAAPGRDENSDIELIPDEIMSGFKPLPEAGIKTDTTDATTTRERQVPYRLKVFLDESFQGNFERKSSAVPLPRSGFSNWNNRISLDLRAEVWLAPTMSLTVADRVNHLLNEGADPSEDDLQNDLKEAYLTWTVHRSDYLDFGRVNVKNGVAIGFNPTDYFKKNSVTTRISEDPTILRENRLGVVMARGQAIWEKGAFTLVIAPEVPHDRDLWWTDGTGDLGLDRTNSTTRFLTKVNVNAFRDLNPELLYFHEEGQSACGLNLTRGFGDKVIAYTEWSIGRRRDIIGEALRDARSSGTIPPNETAVLPEDSEIRFRNQLALGFSYTEDVKRTTWFEYHYNEAGFSQGDWERWFDTGASAGRLLKNPATEASGRSMLGQLWTIRKWAQEAQEPLSRHSVFIRSQWEEAFVTKLNLTGIILVNLYDGSFFLQPLAEYHLSDNLTLSLTLNFFLGSDKSEFGSTHQLGNVKGGATWYF